MIDLQQLAYLHAIAEYGTISRAAEFLHVSQPAISRSMQNLEEELQVQLLTRKKNRVALNENGRLALKFSERILTDIDDMVEQIRALDRSRRTISLASIAPAPMWEIIPTLNKFFPNQIISAELIEEEKILDSTYQLAILSHGIDDPQFFSKPWDSEKLSFLLPKDHHLASRSSLRFSDLDGETILIFAPIGFWNRIRDLMPKSKFIEQEERQKFSELIAESNLLAFTSNKTINREGIPSNRVAIPIEDSEASVEYFLCCRIESRKIFERLFESRGD